MTDLIPCLKLFFQSTFLPLELYNENQCMLRLPLEEKEYRFTDNFRQSLMQSDKPVHYLVSGTFLHFGIVKRTGTEEYLIVGPVVTSRIHPNILPKIMIDCSVSARYQEEVWNFFQMTPAFSQERFLCHLALLHAFINQENIDPFTYFEPAQREMSTVIDQKHSNSLYQAKEEESLHNTYQFEQELYHYVEEGNVEGIENISLRSHNLISGLIGNNSLRQEKNLLIASVTLLTRHSIAGGLDIETAYQLSDVYIQESEKAQTIDTVNRLAYTALLDFTERVAANKIPQGMSPDIFRCIQYVSTHTNQPVLVQDVADAVGKSRSYISQRFKQELGFNLNDFIMRKKLEEGKSLLAFTDKSIGEISEYLCFSSQSYFQNVFKKTYSVTPYEYRKSRK